MINSAGLVMCNKGQEPTHQKRSIIDLTITTPHTAQCMTKWKVLDKESLSDHYYILFEITPGPPKNEMRRNKIDAKKLKTLLKSDYFSRILDKCTDANQCAVEITNAINGCRPTG